MNIQFLEWDSENFGFKVGQLFLTESTITKLGFEYIKKISVENRYKLVYIISEHKLEDIDLFCSEKLVYRKSAEKSVIVNKEDFSVFSYTSNVVGSDLISLSHQSGEFSRFNLDPRFPTSLYKKLYTKWIKNSVLSDFATDTLVYKDGDIIRGLLTYKSSSGLSSIGIIAVHKECRGMGIGRILMREYERRLDSNVKFLDVTTQRINRNACAFYEKNGYKLHSSTYIYHLWL